MKRIGTLFLAGICASVILLFPLTLNAQDESGEPAADLILIMDASGSMWGQVKGENKIVIARRVLKELAMELPPTAEVGLIAYGHRKEGDCADIETVVPIGKLDANQIGSVIDGINPKGKTPITDAVNRAFELAKSRGKKATIILVSDGLETCSGDPCQAVRQARESGIDFVMHVVGFDVGEVDVSQLECAAQAGGGQYFGAQDAEELASALEQAVDTPEDQIDGWLSVKAVVDGELTDVGVLVYPAGSGESVAGGRTYSSPETNPRIIPLANGTYNVDIQAVGFKGNTTRRFEGIQIANGDTVLKFVDFTSGDIVVGVRRNEQLSDAVVRIYNAGTNQLVSGGRTYRSADSNPASFSITSGTYDLEIEAIEISDNVTHRWEGVVVEPKGRTEHTYNFDSGTLRIGVVQGSTLVDATVNIYKPDVRQPVAAARTYTSENTNPKPFLLSPGRYRVVVNPVRLDGAAAREFEIEVSTGSETEHTVDYSQ